MVAVALALRWPFRNEISGDYRAFIGPWYDYVKGHGGFAALSAEFSNYNPPYLYLIVLATWLPVSKIVAVKLVSVSFDLLLAYAMYKLVSLRPGWTWQPLAAAAVALVLPTVVLNSSYWAQCDSIYASLALLALYHQLRGRTVWAAVFIGLAISFKLQAVFMLPVLLMVLVAQPIRWRRTLLAMALIPVTFVVMLLPALAAGASVSALAGVYPAQISDSGQGGAVGGGSGGGPGAATGGVGGAVGGTTGGVGEGGRGDRRGFGRVRRPCWRRWRSWWIRRRRCGKRWGRRCWRGRRCGRQGRRGTGAATDGFGGSASSAPYTRNAASFYQWLSADAGTFWKFFGFAMAAIAIGVAVGLAWRHRRTITTCTLIALAASQLVAIPFFLPQMHDRYFYLADALLVAGAFVVPRLIPSAIAAQGASLIVYASYLWNGTTSLRLAATLEFVALVGCVWATAWSLRDDRSRRETPEPPALGNAS